MGKKKELKLELFFGSIFISRLERCVNNPPFFALIETTAAVRQSFYL